LESFNKLQKHDQHSQEFLERVRDFFQKQLDTTDHLQKCSVQAKQDPHEQKRKKVDFENWHIKLERDKDFSEQAKAEKVCKSFTFIEYSVGLPVRCKCPPGRPPPPIFIFSSLSLAPMFLAILFSS
jgi:hypothetical protein